MLSYLVPEVKPSDHHIALPRNVGASVGNICELALYFLHHNLRVGFTYVVVYVYINDFY